MISRKTKVLLGIAIALTAASGALALPRDAKARILEASGTLTGMGPATTREQVTGALVQLLDVAAEVTPQGPYREEIRSRIGVAKDLITRDSLFNEKARQYLSFAYRMLTGGRKFERPKELEEFVTPAELQEKNLKYMKAQFGNAIASLEAGNPGDTARDLVEIVILTVTPVEG